MHQNLSNLSRTDKKKNLNKIILYSIVLDKIINTPKNLISKEISNIFNLFVYCKRQKFRTYKKKRNSKCTIIRKYNQINDFPGALFI